MTPLEEEPIVTLKDVYLAVQSIDKRLGSVETYLPIWIDAKKDHEARIRSVEKWAYAIPPSLLLALAAMIMQFVRK